AGRCQRVAVRPGPGEQVRRERTADWLLANCRRGARADPRSSRGQAGSVVGRERLARQQYGQTHISAEDRRKGQQRLTNAKQLVERIAAEADATVDVPVPSDEPFTRPNKSVTVATRVAPAELAMIEDLAGQLDVPVSSL